MTSAHFGPASEPLKGALRPPSDKSISHRAALIAAMGEGEKGETVIEGYLDAADTRSTLEAIKALGAKVVEERLGKGGGTAGARGLQLRIRGVGLRNPKPADIDVGNAGTLLRLLPGWLAGQERGRWSLDGDQSIRRRPVDRIALPLREMGAHLSAREDRLPPLEVRGASLHGITYEMPVASAQVKSCLLFAGLLAEGETRVIEPAPSRDHTERMLEAAGASVRTAGNEVVIQLAEQVEPDALLVPGDISSAAFFLVAAVLVPESEIELEWVGVNPTRTGLLGILGRMGAEIERDKEAESGGERVARLRVRSASKRSTDGVIVTKLTATEVAGPEVPLAIDELPLVALAACFAEGTTRIRDAEELRRKESDRIATVAEALNELGGKVEATADGWVIEGTGGLRGGMVESHGDHRIAMLGAVAGLASEKGVEVRGMEAAAVSYPGFEDDLASLLGA